MEVPARVVASVRARVRESAAVCGMASMVALAQESAPVRNFRLACQAARRSPVCEVRRADEARRCVAHGCSAVSVGTWAGVGEDPFGELLDVRGAVDVPVLQRDLVVSDYQVWESRAFGADAISLLPALHPPARLARLMVLAQRLGMTAVAEVHDDGELGIAFELGFQVFVIAAADPDVVPRLRELLPATVLVLAESGGDVVLVGGCSTAAGRVVPRGR